MAEWRSRCLRLVCLEHGAVLWLSSVWVAAALVLFAILQAAADHAFFNHTRDLRIVLGPVDDDAAPAPAAIAFEAGLRRGLAAQREITVLPAERVHGRVAAVLGMPPPPDVRRWMRATRNLNVSYYVTGRLVPRSGSWAGQAEVWQVAEEHRLHSFAADADSPETLGLGLADSLVAALFGPRPVTAAAR